MKYIHRKAEREFPNQKILLQKSKDEWIKMDEK